MTVVLGNGWPGILLHEAIGHGLEGDFNRKGSSAFSGRIGERVAADGVTVVDDFGHHPTAIRETIDRHLVPFVEAGVDPARLGPEASLRDDLGLSSLDAVSLLIALEEELDLEISDEELRALEVLGDLVHLPDAKLAARGAD